VSGALHDVALIAADCTVFGSQIRSQRADGPDATVPYGLTGVNPDPEPPSALGSPSIASSKPTYMCSDITGLGARMRPFRVTPMSKWTFVEIPAAQPYPSRLAEAA